ncbi:MAG: hypothetical protein COU72_04085 [Parcubacteria group bacterium CG10_big_fil_rev_8_21_14_0_10_41_35]|nr:MAG: hypothetical protein COU72_04085 [Parcubacteria group bacterium CG10_big_fil_rev_8_21_14_0_10_41_35]
MDYSNVLNYATPAIIIAALVYSVKFFGKVIADQRPLVDDRSWDVELVGIHFVLNLTVSAVIGVTIALHFPIIYSDWFVNPLIFLGISIIGAVIFMQNTILGGKIYKIKIPILERAPLIIKNEIEVLVKISKYFPRSIFEITLFYFIALGFLSHSILWLTIMSVQALFVINYIALNFSLKQIKELPKVDIYLIGVSRPIRNVMLLKVTTDSVRTRNKDVITIYNKNQILKLAIKLPKDIVR